MKMSKTRKKERVDPLGKKSPSILVEYTEWIDLDADWTAKEVQ